MFNLNCDGAKRVGSTKVDAIKKSDFEFYKTA